MGSHVVASTVARVHRGGERPVLHLPTEAGSSKPVGARSRDWTRALAEQSRRDVLGVRNEAERPRELAGRVFGVVQRGGCEAMPGTAAMMTGVQMVGSRWRRTPQTGVESANPDEPTFRAPGDGSPQVGYRATQLTPTGRSIQLMMFRSPLAELDAGPWRFCRVVVSRERRARSGR